jgi:hypothetical protein
MAGNGLFETSQDLFNRRRSQLQQSISNIQNQQGLSRQGRGVAGLSSIALAYLGQREAEKQESMLGSLEGELGSLQAGQDSIAAVDRTARPSQTTDVQGALSQGYSPQVLTQQEAATNSMRDEAIAGSGLDRELKGTAQTKDTYRRSGGSPDGLIKASKAFFAAGDFENGMKALEVAKSMAPKAKTVTLTEAQKAERGITARGVFQQDPSGKLNQVAGTGGDVDNLSSADLLRAGYTPSSIKAHKKDPTSALALKDNWVTQEVTVGHDINGQPITQAVAINKSRLPKNGQVFKVGNGNEVVNTKIKDNVAKRAQEAESVDSPTTFDQIPIPSAYAGTTTAGAVEGRSGYLEGLRSIKTLMGDIYHPRFDEVVGTVGQVKGKFSRIMGTPVLQGLAARAEQGGINRGIESARKLAPVSDTDFAKLLQGAPLPSDNSEVWSEWYEGEFIPKILDNATSFYGEDYVNKNLRPVIEFQLKTHKDNLKETKSQSTIDFNDLGG